MSKTTNNTNVLSTTDDVQMDTKTRIARGLQEISKMILKLYLEDTFNQIKSNHWNGLNEDEILDRYELQEITNTHLIFRDAESTAPGIFPMHIPYSYLFDSIDDLRGAKHISGYTNVCNQPIRTLNSIGINFNNTLVNNGR